MGKDHGQCLLYLWVLWIQGGGGFQLLSSGGQVARSRLNQAQIFFECRLVTAFATDFNGLLQLGNGLSIVVVIGGGEREISGDIGLAYRLLFRQPGFQERGVLGWPRPGRLHEEPGIAG